MTEESPKEKKNIISMDPPESVESGLEEWMQAGKDRKDVIPLEDEGKWMQIGFDMANVGATKKIWGKSQDMIAFVENEAGKRQHQKLKSSAAVLAQLVKDYYLQGCIEFMVKKINGKDVDEAWLKLNASQSLGNVLKIWMEHKLVNAPYPKPAWLLRHMGYEEEADQLEKEGKMLQGAVSDPQPPSGCSGGGDGTGFSSPLSGSDTPPK